MTRTALATDPPEMTLGEAIGLLRYAPNHACACFGGPRCCVHIYAEARQLQRAAHIAAKMMADALTLQHRKAARTEEWKP